MSQLRSRKIPSEIARKLAAHLDSGVFAALAEPVRVELVRVLLLHGPADVATISEHFAQDRSVVSRHLKVMRDAGLVTVTRDSRRRVYELDGPGLVAVFESITREAKAAVAACC